MGRLQAIYPQYTSHVVSLTPLREYLNKFQGYLDSLNNTPLEPTELEKANTLLAGVESVRYQVSIFNLVLNLQRSQDIIALSGSIKP